MSEALHVSIDDKATPAVRRFIDNLSAKSLGDKLGPGLTNLVQKQLISNGKNKKGWPTTNFWSGAAKSTSWVPTGAGVMISINQIGVRQRVFGGTIEPENAKALTIPMTAAAYGHVAREFTGTFLLRTKTGSYIAQAGESISASGNVVKASKLGGDSKVRIRAGVNILFKLVASVDQEANPDAIPSDDALGNEAIKIIQRSLS